MSIHSPNLPHDFYICIAKQISDPITFLAFLQTCRMCNDIGIAMKEIKKKEFYLEEWIITTAPVSTGRYVYLKTLLYHTPPTTILRQCTDENFHNLRIQGCVINGMKKGEWRKYKSNGALKYITHYDDDLLHGIRLKFNLAGTIMLSENYLKGKLYGRYEYFESSGRNIHIIETYIDGILNGERREYYVNGITKLVENYVDGNLHGECNLYYDNGNLHKKDFYNNSNLNGETRIYYYNGNIRVIKNYINHELNGYCTEYFDNGVISEREFFDDGRINGPYVYYYPNGQKQQEGYFVNGNENGDHIDYNIDGSVYGVRRYNSFIQGEIISRSFR